MDALRTFAGEQWSVEYDQAWRDAYAVIAAEDDPRRRRRTPTTRRTGTPRWSATSGAAGTSPCSPAGRCSRSSTGPASTSAWSAGTSRGCGASTPPPTRPDKDSSLDFHVRAIGAGWVSSSLVRRLKPGDMIRLAAPMGSMTLDRPLDPRHRLRRRRHRPGPDQGPDRGADPLQPHPLGPRLLRRQGPRGPLRPGRLNRLAARYPWLSVVAACSEDPTYPGEKGNVSDDRRPLRPLGRPRLLRLRLAVDGPSTLRTLAEMQVPSIRIKYDAFGDM